MKSKLLILLFICIILMFSGCGLSEGAPFQTDNIEVPSPSYSKLASQSQTQETSEMNNK